MPEDDWRIFSHISYVEVCSYHVYLSDNDCYIHSTLLWTLSGCTCKAIYGFQGVRSNIQNSTRSTPFRSSTNATLCLYEGCYNVSHMIYRPLRSNTLLYDMYILPILTS